MGMRRQQLLYATLFVFLFGMYTKTNFSYNGSREKREEVPNRVSSQDLILTEMMKAVVKLGEKIDVLSENIKNQAEDIKSAQPNQPQRKTAENRLKEFQKTSKEAKAELKEKRDYSKDYVNGRLVSSKGSKVKIVLLVGSTARSGTSFLGELLSQFSSFLYLFEPELYVRVATTEMVTEEYGMPHLQDMIHCRFNQRFIEWLKTRASSYNCFRHPTTRINCRNWETCLTVPRLTEACRQEDIRIIKVIRIRMSWLKILLDDPHIDLKVIHLVRDPRGSLFSMAKHNLHKLEPDYYCPLIEEDILETPNLIQKYPGKVMGLTYEELCLDPMGKASEIWRFLAGDKEAKLSPRWASYMEQHMSRSSQARRVAVYSTYRNTTEQYQAWRNDITESALRDIEANCGGVLKLLGYNLFGSLENARNGSNPLFVNPPPDKSQT